MFCDNVILYTSCICARAAPVAKRMAKPNTKGEANTRTKAGRSELIITECVSYCLAGAAEFRINLHKSN